MKTIDAANGRWREILPALGIPSQFLSGKHQPCLLCGGKDRARFTDLDGRGSYFCNQCGAGTGMQLLMKFKNWDFAKAASEVDAVIGKLPKVKPRFDLRHKATAHEMNALWNSGQQVKPDDPAGRYLAKRGLMVTRDMATALRFVPRLKYSKDIERPGMIAKFSDASGHAKQIHRTYLTADGDKADLDPNRKFMPGDLPKGGAIRFGLPGHTMGVAEGIETALSAMVLYHMPVSATTSALMLREWQAPLTVARIVVFADSDANFCGEAAAFALANKLVLDAQKRGIPRDVDVKVPEGRGKDWNDILQEQNHARTTH